jgi:hypothetical protein
MRTATLHGLPVERTASSSLYDHGQDDLRSYSVVPPKLSTLHTAAVLQAADRNVFVARDNRIFGHLRLYIQAQRLAPVTSA